MSSTVPAALNGRAIGELLVEPMIICHPITVITDAIDAAKPSTLTVTFPVMIHKRSPQTYRPVRQIARMLEFFAKRRRKRTQDLLCRCRMANN